MTKAGGMDKSTPSQEKALKEENPAEMSKTRIGIRVGSRFGVLVQCLELGLGFCKRYFSPGGLFPRRVYFRDLS